MSPGQSISLNISFRSTNLSEVEAKGIIEISVYVIDNNNEQHLKASEPGSDQFFFLSALELIDALSNLLD